MALATFDDLSAVGGIVTDIHPGSPEWTRAERLLELSSGLVLSYLDRFGVTADDVEVWEDFRKVALSAIVAEVAVKRLNVSAAASVDPYGQFAAMGPQTIKLTRWEHEAIRDLLPGSLGGGSFSVEVERDFSGLHTGVVEAFE